MLSSIQGVAHKKGKNAACQLKGKTKDGGEKKFEGGLGIRNSGQEVNTWREDTYVEGLVSSPCHY
jgi:hypothetical protein